MRELTEAELDLISGGYDWDNEDIVVTGSPYPPTYPPYWYPPVFSPGGYTPTPSPPPYTGGGNPPPPPPPTCPDTSTMTPEQKADYEIDSEAADVRREILAMGNQNMEYGAIIYRDAAGQLQHTPLRTSADYHANIAYDALPKNSDGTPDYSGVVGIIHSHPQYLPNANGTLDNYYNPADPGRLTRPSNAHTRDGVSQGDWVSWDSLVANINYDKGDASKLRQYIVGYDGTGMKLNEYNAANYETQTASGTLDPGMGQCS